MRQEAHALRDAGYEVTVVSPTAARAPETETVVDGVRVLRFAAPPMGRGAAAYLEEYAVALHRLRRLVRRLRTEPPFAAVIACNPPDFLIQLARPLRRAGAALIFDFHDPSPELFEAKYARRGLLYAVLRRVEREAFRVADVVMTVNDVCAAIVRERGAVPADRVFVVRNYPDPGRFFPVPARPQLREGREHLVLWVGRMSEKEGLDLLVDAADELVHARGRTDITFSIVGRGDVRDQLAAEIDRRGLSEFVRLPGEADDPALREYMATADVCLSLDRRNEMNDRSLMIKVFEYMAMGRAIVQFPLSEMRRVCGDATVYARDGDAVDVAERIARLIDDPAARQALGRAAAERVRDGLTWPDQVPTLLRAVEAAIARRRADRR